MDEAPSAAAPRLRKVRFHRFNGASARAFLGVLLYGALAALFFHDPSPLLWARAIVYLLAACCAAGMLYQLFQLFIAVSSDGFLRAVLETGTCVPGRILDVGPDEDVRRMSRFGLEFQYASRAFRADVSRPELNFSYKVAPGQAVRVYILPEQLEKILSIGPKKGAPYARVDSGDALPVVYEFVKDAYEVVD